MISRCSSPMPAMTVWPVSSSVRTRKVGSSSDRRWRAVASFSWSCLVFGSIARSMTGSGNVIRSRITGSAVSVSVSPVVVDFRPTAATMSPAETSSTSSRWFACIISRRPARSLRSFVALMIAEPLFMRCRSRRAGR